MIANITKKQAGVIYAAYKRGDIQATNETISEVYNWSDSFIHQTTDAVSEDVALTLKSVVDAIFQNDYSEAQHNLDRFVGKLDHYFTKC